MKHFVIFLIGMTCLFADTTEVIIGTPVIGNYIPFWGQSYDACRFQVLFLQSEINNAGRIIKFAFQPSTSNSGTYNNFRFYFCHTNVTQLSTVFNDNYGGNTPELMIDSASFTVGGPANQWLEWPVSFNYNNTLNLLVEIRWRTDGGVGVPMWRTSEAVPRRVYNMTDDNATSGTTQNTSNYVKLTIERVGIKGEKTAQDLAMTSIIVNPNPIRTGNKVTVKVPDLKEKIAEIHIYNISGELVHIIPVRNTKAVWDLRDRANISVPAGVYFIKAGIYKARVMVIH